MPLCLVGLCLTRFACGGMSLRVTVCVEPQSKQVSAEGPESSGGGGDGQLYVVLGALPQLAAVLVRHLHSGTLWVQLRLHLLWLF